MMSYGPGIRLLPEEFWTTRDGRTIPVGRLSPDHMRNILRMLLRRRRERLVKLSDEDKVRYRMFLSMDELPEEDSKW